MDKIRRIHDFQHSFSFSSQEEQFDAFYARFLEGDLGKIHMAVPWDDLVAAFRPKEAKKGPRCLFSAKGKLALMFLKNYSGLSDRKLIEHLNGNLDRQFFSDIYLGTQRLSRSADGCLPPHWKERHNGNGIRKAPWERYTRALKKTAKKSGRDRERTSLPYRNIKNPGNIDFPGSLLS